jgi:hypothetical protein
LGLVDKVKVLDNYLKERHLEKEFSKERFDYYGIDYDGSISTESYIQIHKLHLPLEEVEEYEVVIKFEEYQLSGFKSALIDIKNSFVKEFITATIPLVQKIAYGNSLKQKLIRKLEKFRNHKTGRKFAGILSDFINELTVEYIDYEDRDGKSNNSFKYLPKAHWGTLNKLFHALIDNELLGGETAEADFHYIFQNLKVENPVRWIGHTSELKYFIELINRTDLGFEDKGSYKWRIAVKCFLKVSSTPLKTITFTDLRTYKVTPKTKEKLDNILVNKILKTPILR